MTDDEKRALVDRYVAAYNAFDVDGMMATVHPDIEFENRTDGRVDAAASGADAFRQMADKASRWFSSRHQSITSFEATDMGAAISVAYTAVLAMDLPDRRQAGGVIHLVGRSEFAFEDERISRITDIS